jgi:hypothetical protein
MLVPALALAQVQVKDLIIILKGIIRDRRVVKEMPNEVDITQEALKPLIRMRMISQHTVIDPLLIREDPNPKEGMRERPLINRFLTKKLLRRVTTEETETG